MMISTRERLQLAELNKLRLEVVDLKLQIDRMKGGAMTDRFTEVQPGQPGWYWHHDRVVEVVRDGSGKLWTRWDYANQSPSHELPEGPRCVRPSE